MPGGYEASRKGRASVAGQIYLATFTTHGRAPHFLDPELARGACRLLASNERWRSNHLLAWVLMSDHWHGLVQLGEQDDLPACIRKLKGATAHDLRVSNPGIPRIWGDGYHDHAVRAEEELLVIARYIIANPLRAGIARSVATIRMGIPSGCSAA